VGWGGEAGQIKRRRLTGAALRQADGVCLLRRPYPCCPSMIQLSAHQWH